MQLLADEQTIPSESLYVAWRYSLTLDKPSFQTSKELETKGFMIPPIYRVPSLPNHLNLENLLISANITPSLLKPRWPILSRQNLEIPSPHPPAPTHTHTNLHFFFFWWSQFCLFSLIQIPWSMLWLLLAH